jgi:hypothetical protein
LLPATVGPLPAAISCQKFIGEAPASCLWNVAVLSKLVHNSSGRNCFAVGLSQICE